MISDIEAYFIKGCGRCKRFGTPDCSTQLWHQGLGALREICRNAKLQETVKWGHPCYVHAGRNIAYIGAFRTDFRLSFFNAVLLKDPDGVLERQGPNTKHADMIQFTDEDRVEALAPTMMAFLEEAKAYAEQGIRPKRENDAIVLPFELEEALADDPELKIAFFRLTPGRQKSYVIHLNSAKKAETRKARIAKCREKIMACKGALER